MAAPASPAGAVFGSSVAARWTALGAGTTVILPRLERAGTQEVGQMKRIVRCLAAAASPRRGAGRNGFGRRAAHVDPVRRPLLRAEAPPVIATQPGQPEAVWERASGSTPRAQRAPRTTACFGPDHREVRHSRGTTSTSPPGPTTTTARIRLPSRRHERPDPSSSRRRRRQPRDRADRLGRRAGAQGDRYLVQFRAQGNRWRTWKRKTRRLQGVFGKQDQPISPRLGATYQVRVRSFVAKDPARAAVLASGELRRRRRALAAGPESPALT